MRTFSISICLLLEAICVTAGHATHPGPADRATPAAVPRDSIPQDSVRMMAKPGRGGKTTVPRRSKDPVNIPVSSGRFRPTFEGNGDRQLLYQNGWLILGGDPGETLMRMIVATPGARPELYRFDGRRRFCRYIGTETGEYTVRLLGTAPPDARADCIFIFEIVD